MSDAASTHEAPRAGAVAGLALEPLLARAEELARRWAIALILQRPLRDIGGIQLQEIGSDAPSLCAQAIRALQSDAEVERLGDAGARGQAPPLRSLARIAGAPGGRDLVQAMEALRGVLWEALLEEIRVAPGGTGTRRLLDAGDRLAYVCARMLAGALGGDEEMTPREAGADAAPARQGRGGREPAAGPGGAVIVDEQAERAAPPRSAPVRAAPPRSAPERPVPPRSAAEHAAPGRGASEPAAPGRGASEPAAPARSASEHGDPAVASVPPAPPARQAPQPSRAVLRDERAPVQPPGGSTPARSAGSTSPAYGDHPPERMAVRMQARPRGSKEVREEIAIRDARGDRGPAAWIGTIGRQLERLREDGLSFAVLLVEPLELERLRGAGPAADMLRLADEVEDALAVALRLVPRRETGDRLTPPDGPPWSDSLTRERPGRYWLLAPETDRAGAERLAQRLSRAVASLVEHRGVPVEVAIGIAVGPQDGTDAAALAAHADVGLYAARSTRSRPRGAARTEGWG